MKQRAAEPENRKRAIALKLTVLARQLSRDFDQSVERIGLSRAKFSAIAVVARNPGATQRLIADKLEMTEAAAGRLIERLCQDGHVERRQDPEDRRAYRVFLTDAAQPVLDRLGGLATIHENAAFAGLDADDLVRFEQLLDTVARNIAEGRGRAAAADTPSPDTSAAE